MAKKKEKKSNPIYEAVSAVVQTVAKAVSKNTTKSKNNTKKTSTPKTTKTASTKKTSTPKTTKSTQKKPAQQKYRAESATEADAHYINALRKQYGNYSTAQIREKIESNERAVNKATDPTVAKALQRQNNLLYKLHQEKQKDNQEKSSSGKNKSSSGKGATSRDILALGRGPIQTNQPASKKPILFEDVAKRQAEGQKKKAQQKFSVSMDDVVYGETRKKTQSETEKAQKIFDEIKKTLEHMRDINSKGRGYKAYTQKEIDVYAARMKNVGNILAKMYEERGERDRMYEVRSQVSNAVLANERENTPQNVDGVRIPNLIYQGANLNVDEATHRAKADEMAKKYFSKQYSTDGNEVSDFLNRFGANYSGGKLGTSLNRSAYHYGTKPTIGREYAMDVLNEISAEFNKNNVDIVGTGGLIDKNLASYLPQLTEQVGYGLGGAALFGIPVALVGGPTGWKAAKAGYVAGSGKYSYEQAYGASFNNLSQITDMRSAQKLAADEALLSSGIEMGDTALDIARLGFKKAGTAIIKALGRETTEKLSKEGALKLLGGYATSVLGEGGQEGLQEILSIANERRARSGDVDSGKIGLIETAIEVIQDMAAGKDLDSWSRVKESSVEGMKTSTVVGGITTATNAAIVNALGGNPQQVPLNTDDSDEDIQFLIHYDRDNVPFVEVEEDVLQGLTDNEKKQKVKTILKEKFSEGIAVGNELIRVNRDSRNEILNSEYSKMLSRKNPDLYNDKLNSATQLDEILQASRGYVGEKPKHSRNDNIREFARGTVNLRIGKNDYQADVVVGTTRGGNLKFYDLVDFNDIKIKEKAPVTSSAKTNLQNSLDSDAFSSNSIPQNQQKGNKNFEEDFSITTGENGNDVLTSIFNTGNREGYVSPENAVSVEDARGIFRRLGFTVTTVPHIQNMPDNVDGYVDFKNREVYINPNAKDAQEVVIKHEITHILERSAGSKYVTSLKMYIQEYMGAKWDQTYEEVSEKYALLKAEKPDFVVTDTLLESETLAEFVSILSTDAAIRHYSAKNVGFARSISQFFRYIGVQMRVLFKDDVTAARMENLAIKWERALSESMRGGAESVRGSGTQFLFAGERSKLMDEGMLAKAKEMREKGDSQYKIWKKTGWVLAQDGQWRYEIDDSKAKFTFYDSKRRRKTSGLLPQYIKHDELFQAYPFLKHVRVRFVEVPGNDIFAGAVFDLRRNTIELSKYAYPDDLKGSLIHEIQHAIQAYEGSATGASPEGWQNKYENQQFMKIVRSPEYRKFEAENATRDGEIPSDVYDDFFDKRIRSLPYDAAERLYHYTHGEQEAREARRRRTYNAKERKKFFPHNFARNGEPLFSELDIPDTYMKMLLHSRNLPDEFAEAIDVATRGEGESSRPTYDILEYYDQKQGLLKYSDTKSFARQVYETLHDEVYAYEKNYLVRVDDVSPLLTRLGVRGGRLLMTREDLKDAHHKKSPTEPKYQGLSEKRIRKLPDIINSPTIIFDSFFEESPDSIYILSHELDADGFPMLIQINSDHLHSFVQVKTTLLSDLYGKENLQHFLDDLAAHAENILYISKRRTAALSQTSGLTLPDSLKKFKFGSVIRKSKKVHEDANSVEFGGSSNAVALSVQNDGGKKKDRADAPGNITFEDVYFYRSHEDRAKSNRDRNSSVVPLKNDSQSDIIGLNDYRHGGNENAGKEGAASDISGGTGGISSGDWNSGGRDSGNQRDVSFGNTEGTHEGIDNKRNGLRSNSEGSGSDLVVRSPQSAASAEATSGETTDGRRYAEAVKRGNDSVARKLLDAQASSNGYVPAKTYHGTNSPDVFVRFKGDGSAHWVSTDLKYAERYTDGYYGEDVKSSQLHTSPGSGVYDLYIKPGKTLDVGNIETEIGTLEDLFSFAEKIGFSEREILRCWNSQRHLESNSIWTITSSPEFAEIARSYGYDSLRAVEGSAGVETFGVLYSENIKSAKTVTYDEDGRVIPLEKRFDNSTDNIRYSVSRGTVNGAVGGVNADPVSAEMYGKAKSIFERLGFRVISEPNVENMPDNVDGYVDFKRREVYLNPNAVDPMRQVIKHEIAHILERNNSRFARSMIRMFRTDFKAEWAKAEDTVNKNYAGLDLTDRQRTSEIVAEVSLDLTTDAVILRTAQNNPDSMPKIELWWNFLKFEIRKAFGHLTGGRFGGLSAEERIELASQKWKRAYEIAQRQGGRKNLGASSDGVLYKFAGRRADGIEVYETSDVVKAMSYSERNAEFLRIMKEEYRGRTAKFTRNGHTYYAQFEDGDVRKNVYGDKKSDTKGRNAKVKVGADGDIFELVENAKYFGSSPEVGKTSTAHHGVLYWDYFVKTVQIDGRVYDVVANVRKNVDDQFVYSIQLNENKNIEAAPLLQVPEKNPLKSSAHRFDNNRLSQNGSSVNSKYMQSGEKNAGDDVSFAINRGRDISEIIAELDEVDALLDNEALSDEEYRALDRRSRKLERELAIASARGSAAEVQQNSGDVFKNAAEETESAAKAQRKDVPVSYHTDRLRESVENYRETGDSSGIPTRKSAKHSQKYYTEQMDAIMEEIKRVDAEMRSGELTPDEMDVARDRKDMLLTRLRSVGASANVIKDVLGILDEIDTEARPNHTWVNDISHDLSDKKNVVKNGTYGFNDFERNVRHFFGKHFAIAKEKILDPLFQSKKDYAEYVTQYSDRIYNEVVKGLGIKKGSKESAAVQWLGEGQRPMDGKRNSKTEAFEEYTYEKCVQEFGKEDAAKIKKAAEIFRECYDEMIDGVNATRQRLYPNNPDKLIPKRKDYFRHFQEMNNSVPGLIETMRNHAGIDPMLVGVSESTKPKSKWQAAFQTRAGERTVYDAVGGFLDYLPQAAYATHIDPNIVNIRSLAFDLASAKAKEGINGNPNANNFIRYLQNYANKLAGKTVSHLDRAIADSTIGRPLIAGLSWFNNRAKANAVLGNFSSMLSQFANILNAVGTIKNQTDLANGALDAVRGLFGDKEIQAKYEESGFLKERFLGKTYDRFERYGITRLAADALGIADEVGTRITWCAAYREGVRLGKADPVSYADSVTRGCVAGRGIGEVPLNFESTVAKLFLPFRIEVNNNINVYRDILFGNDYEGGKAKKITANMTDAQRYSILRDKTLKVAKAKPLVSENITEADIERLKTKYKKEAKPILKKLADFFGVVGRYENKDIELEFEFSNRSFTESHNKQKKQYTEFAKMLSVFDEVIENAIGIDVHKDRYAGTIREDSALKQAYVLASAFSDENGIHPVKLTVKEYFDRNNKLHVAVVVNKKEDAFSVQTAHQNGNASYTPASSNISLAQLLSIVKDEDFDKYIPKQFKNLKQTDFDEIMQNSGKDGGVVKRSVAHRTKQILKLFVASAVINALFGALKSDEFNPLDDLFGAGEDDEEEERDVFDRILALGKDYADGRGDGVAFDPIHGFVSGIYQGMTEDENASVGKKIGKSVLRSAQNVAGDYLSNDPLAAVGIGALGVDNDAIEKIFNGKLYVSPGTGMPAASSIAKSIGYLADGKYASAGAEAAKTFALPFGGSQVDKSARGLYEFATGASTTTRPYERMVGADEGTLKYLIEPNAENLIKSTLFGPSAFSGASDDFYNSKRRLTEEETDEVLALPDYKSRKVAFDDLIAGKEYRADDAVTARRDAAAEEYKNLVGENSAIYALYKNGVMAASPFRNVPLDMRMTIDGTKYTLNISADDATAASETLSAVLSERFREIDKSEKFRKMTPEKQEKYLGSIGDLEYEKIKADVLYERGIMPEDVYLDYIFSYERSRANQDRKMFVDDAQEFVDAQAATMAQQYMQYIGDERITDEVVRHVRKYTDYATHRAPTDVDRELMRLSNSLQAGNADLSDLNACGNPSGVLTFTKKGVEYYINVPDTMTYEIMATVDDSCRSALSTLFSSSTYKSASDEVKKDLISKTKSKVRARVKANLKAQFPSVRVDEFQKIINMGGK